MDGELGQIGELAAYDGISDKVRGCERNQSGGGTLVPVQRNRQEA